MIKKRILAKITTGSIFLTFYGFVCPSISNAQNNQSVKIPYRADVNALSFIKDETKQLSLRMESVRKRLWISSGKAADAAIFLKGAQWAMRYETNPSPSDINLISTALIRGRERIEELESGTEKWGQLKGRLVRGYVSKVDGSAQPYGLIIPSNYSPDQAIRLDVVLHGSSQPTGMSELNFMSRFDRGDKDNSDAPDAECIELHPLGRVENCYRWAGETDVFEAIEDVCGHYHIDRDRIVLRGMSMGASGTWHIGLKHPDYFVALGPYCGYVDTHRFSETPGMNFVKVGSLPEYQELGLHMLDSVDYAANAGMVPAIGAIGDRDPFFQAHVIMGEAMRKEGLQMINLISPGTAHIQDPANFSRQMGQIERIAVKGLNHLPLHIRFVTWTLKYASCYWIKILRLGAHYHRAEITADISDINSIRVQEPLNITRFAILSAAINGATTQLKIGDQKVNIPRYGGHAHSLGIALVKKGKRWVASEYSDSDLKRGKTPDMQGPIDHAFTTPFLCVSGTGKAWNPAVQRWVEANLRRFSYEWSRYFRGDLPIKKDTEVTPDDCKRCNLILFGDPGSNIWIRKALKSSPLKWNRESFQIANRSYPSTNTAPALICPSPFTREGEKQHYLVINSGHTFHEAELNRLNYLLYPHQADWAVFKIGDTQPENPSALLAEELLLSGYFNEEWK